MTTNKGKPERDARKCHNSYLGGQRGSAGKNGSANWFCHYSDKWSGKQFVDSERESARANHETLSTGHPLGGTAF